MAGRRSVVRNSLLVVALVASTSLLTGCLRSEMGVHVDGDGSGRVDMEAYFDDVSLQGGRYTIDDLVRLGSTATKNIKGAEVSKVKAAGSEGVRLSLPFDDYRQLTQTLTTGEIQGYSTRLFQTFEIAEKSGGHWTMAATVDPTNLRTVLSQIPAGLGASASLIGDSTDFIFEVSLPGKVMHSNADQTDGGSARWNLKGDVGPQMFTMENEPKSLSTLQIVLIAGGALVLLGFILLFMTAAGSKQHGRRRGKKHKVDPSGGKSWAPTEPVAVALNPDQWSSPPPYSSHGYGEATPSGANNEARTGGGVFDPSSQEPVGAATQSAVQPVAQAAVVASARPAPQPAPQPAPTTTWQPTSGSSDRAGPPVLPAGFVPTPSESFPLTHGYTNPTGPLPSAPAGPTPGADPAVVAAAAAPVVPVAPGVAGTSGRAAPPPLPDGFVPDAPISFPVTHSAGPPPSSAPSTPLPHDMSHVMHHEDDDPDEPPRGPRHLLSHEDPVHVLVEEQSDVPTHLLHGEPSDGPADDLPGHRPHGLLHEEPTHLLAPDAPVQQEHVAPVQQEYVAPVQQEYFPPPVPEYVAPAEQEYVMPSSSEYVAPVQQEYVAPVQQGYVPAEQPVEQWAVHVIPDDPAPEPQQSETYPPAFHVLSEQDLPVQYVPTAPATPQPAPVEEPWPETAAPPQDDSNRGLFDLPDDPPA